MKLKNALVSSFEQIRLYLDHGRPDQVLIQVWEYNDGRPHPGRMQAVVTGIRSNSIGFLAQPRGWGRTRSEAIANCMSMAKRLAIAVESARTPGTGKAKPR